MNITELQSRLRQFAAGRDRQSFHAPKNLSTALFVEAVELADHCSVDIDRATAIRRLVERGPLDLGAAPQVTWPGGCRPTLR